MSQPKNFRFNENNFDLIRLFAAMQVAVHHAAHHLKVHNEPIISGIVKVLDLFPGVPIFFFISGFLISKSFESNSRILHYTKNRALRLFPGLIVCGVVTVAMISMSGYFSEVDVSSSGMAIWIISQLTFFQFYDPDFLSGYGIGQANGSLWTIYIEIQFYILVPFIYLTLNSVWSTVRSFNRVVLLMLVFFYLVHLLLASTSGGGLLLRLAEMTFVPYFYMFLIGMLFQRHFDFFSKLLEGRFIVLLVIYFAVCLGLNSVMDVTLGNAMNPLLYMVLCCLTFSAAFSMRGLGRKLLQSNDISYGVYIYHMPIVNLFIYLGMVSSTGYFYLALLASILVAAMSWMLIEKPFMKLKNQPLNPLRKINL